MHVHTGAGVREAMNAGVRAGLTRERAGRRRRFVLPWKRWVKHCLLWSRTLYNTATVGLSKGDHYRQVLLY